MKYYIAKILLITKCREKFLKNHIVDHYVFVANNISDFRLLIIIICDWKHFNSTDNYSITLSLWYKYSTTVFHSNYKNHIFAAIEFRKRRRKGTSYREKTLLHATPLQLFLITNISIRKSRYSSRTLRLYLIWLIKPTEFFSHRVAGTEVSDYNGQKERQGISYREGTDCSEITRNPDYIKARWVSWARMRRTGQKFSWRYF